jgi:hypothetical protein
MTTVGIICLGVSAGQWVSRSADKPDNHEKLMIEKRRALELTTAQLWDLLPGDFNVWRVKHDLPGLLDYFASILPGFSDWQATLPFDREVMLRVVPTGELFKGEMKALVRRQYDFMDINFGRGNDYSAYYHSASLVEAEDLGEPDAFQVFEVVGSFLPYFAWAKKHLGTRRFFDPYVFPYNLDGRTVDTFSYLPGTGTQVSLFGSFPVLKLGNFKLDGVYIGNRNLDFTDLGHLTFAGEFYGIRQETINFSSCDRWRFTDCKASSFSFYCCSFPSPMEVEKSRIEGFSFDHIDNLALSMTGSSVYGLRVTNTPLKTFIRDCQFTNVSYMPPASSRPSDVATTFRMLRAVYQASGQRQEASSCYYLERKYERKALFWPKGKLSWREFKTAFRDFKAAKVSRAGLRSALKEVSWARLRTFFTQDAFPVLRSKMRWSAAMFEEMLWGYGERPGRIVFWIIATIPAYAVAYHCQSLPNKAGGRADWIDVFYFSAVTFTTLGYGDITPTTETLKLLSGTEALLGGLSLGLVVAGFSNRSRY